jgi:predicted ATPase
MYIKSISLKNFKGFDDITLSFEKENQKEARQWTILLGENGVGKSNFLKAIALLCIGNRIELMLSSEELIQYGHQVSSIKAVFDIDGNAEERIIAFGTVMDYQNTSNPKLKNLLVVAYGATRGLNLGNHLGNSSIYKNKDTQAIGNLFNPNSALYSITTWAMEMDYIKGEKGLKIVKQALEGFLQDINFVGIDKEKRQLMFKTSDGIFALEQLSDGYKNMAAWFGDLMSRITEHYKDIENPLLAKGILLFDELELHLHPTWQRKLYDFISEKLPNFQVIATTHSPLTAQQAQENELYALKRFNNRIELIPFVGSPRKMLINQLLMSPVFGISSDEALSVEKAKEDYRKSAAKSRKIASKGLESMNSFTDNALASVLPDRASLAISDEQKDLLERLEQALNL